MRWIIALILIFVGVVQTAANTIVEVPASGSFEIVGPFTTDPVFGPNTLLIQFSFLASGPIPPFSPPTNSLLEGFLAGENISSGLQSLSLFACGNNFGPGPCLAGSESSIGLLQINSANNFITTEAGLLLASAIQNNNEVPFGVPVTFSLDVSLPDGFTVAAIPEPSTWAMLLIGFAAIGFARRRLQLAR